jgi:hypothetical protein
MMHTKTPDEQGWYWIEDACGGWSIGCLLTNRDDLVLLLADETPDVPCELTPYTLQADGRWYDVGEEGYSPEPIQPVRWFGPLHCPGGDFHEHVVECDAPTHNDAKAQGKVMVMLVKDYKYCGEHSYRTIESGLMAQDDADKVKVFDHTGERT